MRTTKRFLPFIFILLLVAFTATISFASKVDDLIKQAQSEVVKASAPGVSSADRDENYKKAIDDYNAVIKQAPNAVEGAQALLGIAQIYDTAKGTYGSAQQAYDGYTSVVNQFDKPTDVLAQTLEQSEIREIKGIVASAKQKQTELSERLDKQNSTKTLYKVMDFFVNITGRRPWLSYWLAIIMVTVLVKILITPLTKAQFKAMKEMQKVAPLIKEVQEKHKGDQKVIGEKTMEIYKDHHINPFASCLPLLVQMPILWFLYSMIRTYQFQFQHGHFLWIGGALSNHWAIHLPFGRGGPVWLTAGNLSQPDLILVVLYSVSMYISTRLSAVDPSQADQQKMMAIMMPVMFAFLFATFQSAFLLYWLVFNVLQTTQQYMILRGGQEPPTSGQGAIASSQEPPEEPGSSSADSSRRVQRRRRR